MDAIERFLKKALERRIKAEYDAIVPVVGDEGEGKSTLILRMVDIWQRYQNDWPTVDGVLDTVVWQDRQEFKQAMSSRDERSAIAAMDAARILYKKDAMQGDQKDIEKDLLDVRTKEFLMLLGFQDFDVMPTMLQERRAKFLFRIPERGTVWGYNRDSIDERVESGEWPEPDLEDTFNALDDTLLWEEFQARDKEKKDERIESEMPTEPGDARKEEAIKTVLRATKPWAEHEGMKYREAAKLVDYSKSWVGERVREFREDNMHRDLLDEKELKTAMPQ